MKHTRVSCFFFLIKLIVFALPRVVSLAKKKSQHDSCDKRCMWKTSTTNTESRLKATDAEDSDRLVWRAAGLAANNDLLWHCKVSQDDVLRGTCFFFFLSSFFLYLILWCHSTECYYVNHI